MKQHKAARIALGLSLFLLVAGAAQAAITSFGNRAAFDAAFPGATLETWDEFASGTTITNGSTVNGITYNSSSGDAFVTGGFVVTTSPNSLGNTTLGFFGAGDTITFTFTNALSAFGIDINTFATTNGAYTATTNLGNIVPSVFDPFPGFSTGEFVGFSSTTPFSSVTIAATTGFSYTLDTLRRVSALPEPDALALLGACLAGIGFSSRRRRR